MESTHTRFAISTYTAADRTNPYKQNPNSTYTGPTTGSDGRHSPPSPRPPDTDISWGSTRTTRPPRPLPPIRPSAWPASSWSPPYTRRSLPICRTSRDTTAESSSIPAKRYLPPPFMCYLTLYLPPLGPQGVQRHVRGVS